MVTCRRNSNFSLKYVLYLSITSIHLFSAYQYFLIKLFLKVQEKCSSDTATCLYIFKVNFNAVKSQKL